MISRHVTVLSLKNIIMELFARPLQANKNLYAEPVEID